MLIALFVVVLFYVLEQHTAYHSPLYGAELEWTPRKQGFKDLREWAARKAMEEARRAELLRNLNTEKMVVLGRDIVHGRGLCFNCHKIGEAGRGTQGPDLEDVGARAGNRVAGLSDVEYLAQSLYEPDAFTAPGKTPTGSLLVWSTDLLNFDCRTVSGLNRELFLEFVNASQPLPKMKVAPCG